MTRTILYRAFMLLLCLSLTGCFMLPQEEEALAPPLREVETVTYETVTVGLGDMELTEQVTGYFTSTMRQHLSFGISGRLAAVNVYSGQAVEEGDVLMELDNSDLQKRIRDQEIAIEKLNIQWSKAGQSDDRAVQDAELTLRDAQNHLSDLYAQRSHITLRQDGMPVPGSEQEALYNSINTQIRDQQIVVDRAQARYDQAVADQKNAYDRRALSLDLEAARNTLNDLKEQYEATVLRAPFSGRVSYLAVNEVGASVSAYTTLITLSDPTQLILQYSGTKAGNFPVNLPVTVRVDKEEYSGYVLNNPDSLPRSEDGSVQQIVQFVLTDFDMDQAVEGGSGQVRAVLDSRENVIVLDKAAVTTYLSRKYVRLYVDGLSIERDVQIGLENATKVEILDGLEVGDEVIVN